MVFVNPFVQSLKGRVGNGISDVIQNVSPRTCCGVHREKHSVVTLFIPWTPQQVRGDNLGLRYAEGVLQTESL